MPHIQPRGGPPIVMDGLLKSVRKLGDREEGQPLRRRPQSSVLQVVSNRAGFGPVLFGPSIAAKTTSLNGVLLPAESIARLPVLEYSSEARGWVHTIYQVYGYIMYSLCPGRCGGIHRGEPRPQHRGVLVMEGGIAHQTTMAGGTRILLEYYFPIRHFPAIR